MNRLGVHRDLSGLGPKTLQSPVNPNVKPLAFLSVNLPKLEG